MPEAPWFSEPPNAKIARGGCEDGDVIYGYLHFDDPNGKRAVVPLTLGEQTAYRPVEGDNRVGSPIWHVDLPAEGSDLLTVSPSVHYVGFWHSPNPVQFRLVDELE